MNLEKTINSLSIILNYISVFEYDLKINPHQICCILRITSMTFVKIIQTIWMWTFWCSWPWCSGRWCSLNWKVTIWFHRIFTDKHTATTHFLHSQKKVCYRTLFAMNHSIVYFNYKLSTKTNKNFYFSKLNFVLN